MRDLNIREERMRVGQCQHSEVGALPGITSSQAPPAPFEKKPKTFVSASVFDRIYSKIKQLLRSH